MAKEICISTTPHETRLAILEDDQLAEIYYERENEYTLAGSIYKGKVTRVLPGMQSSFVDVGLERDAFLYVTDFLEDSEDSDEYETSSAGAGRRSERPVGDRPAVEDVPAGEEKRGRRDGRRGDGRRGERTADRPTDRATEQQPVEAAQRPRASEERAAAAAALRSVEPTETDRGEKGDDEETPEGTRRWRGRRGRRRGGMRAGVLGGKAEAGEQQQTAAAPFATAERGAPGGVAAPLEGVGADEDEQEPLELQAAASTQPEPKTNSGREERRDRGRGRDRGGERRPSAVAEADALIAAPSASVLPGESLSKYGSAPAASSTPAATAKLALPGRPVNYTPPKPATLVEVAEGWDGGFVLPGETLSRYKAPAAGETSEAPAGLDQISAESHTELPLEPAPEAVHESGEFAAATAEEQVQVALAAASTDAPEIAAEALPGTEHPETVVTTAEPIDAGEQTDRAVWESADAPGAAPAPEMEAGAAPVHEEPAEYEPEDGGPAIRLSPPSQNELRFSRLFGGGEPAEPVAAAEKPAEPAEPEHAPAAEAGAETSAPGQPERSLLEAGLEPGNGTHDGFTLSKEEMFSDSVFAAGQAETGHPEHAHHADDAPDAHEQAERTRIDGALSTAFADRFADEPHADAAEAQTGEQHPGLATHRSDGFTELVDQLQGFSPGSGLLEEEVIDEDEYDFDPIHTHADEHDLEDLEEETLDGTGHQDIGDEEEEHPGSRADHVGEEDEEEEDAAAFALEEVEEDEEEEAPLAAGEQAPRERSSERPGDDRSRRGSGRNGRRRGGPGGGGRRQSAQTQDLPIISDLLKQGQEILVQIAKEPIAKKGARITSHIALPGRFLVFMPTVGHVGVSRKIASDEERQRLKRILISEKGDSSGGFIVRTAAEGASEEELRADLRFLISLWTEIKQRSETAKAPALIYHDLNLVERILRDQVSSNFSTIWVDTEQEYERIVRFLNRFQPSLVRRVKLYTKETPLFEHFGIQEEISKALKSKVWLKSGGSIVINQTEALVAIDINTGKYVGKTARLEDTIVKTNLDAIPEIVRQIRLRDLGGIIVIDFIDMDERKNRNRVLAALEEAMKVDRAPSKVLQFNDFGLVAITRKRVKQSLERTLSVTCETCAGTGMVKSPITVCNEIFIELRKMQKHLDGKDVMLRVNPEVVKQLKSSNGRWINEYEEMIGKTVIIKSDPSLHPEQFDIH